MKPRKSNQTIPIVSVAAFLRYVYQTELEVLVVTIAKIQDAVRPGWSPREISLAYRSRDDLPDIEIFAGSRVLRGTGETYFTIPRALMGLPFSNENGGTGQRDVSSAAMRPLPEDLRGQVRLQIENLFSDEALSIETVAEIAFKLGYTDASNFTRAFRRKTGVSPHTFRENARQG